LYILVSGGVKGAEMATLTFMVGATSDEFKIIKPFLQCMGKNIVHAGEQGLGLVSLSN
jgi:3-hydroxyisobutyrate dehydrogenase-like beta-hydroxyacid dehydrogenase